MNTVPICLICSCVLRCVVSVAVTPRWCSTLSDTRDDDSAPGRRKSSSDAVQYSLERERSHSNDLRFAHARRLHREGEVPAVARAAVLAHAVQTHHRAFEVRVLGRDSRKRMLARDARLRIIQDSDQQDSTLQHCSGSTSRQKSPENARARPSPFPGPRGTPVGTASSRHRPPLLRRHRCSSPRTRQLQGLRRLPRDCSRTTQHSSVSQPF